MDLIKPFPELNTIHAIAIPLPGFADLITANIYVIGNDPLTLIDTGPKLPGHLEYFQEQLRVAGFELSDLKRIIFTHGHADHFGLAASILRAAGGQIECIVHAEDRWRISKETFKEEIWYEGLDTLAAMAGMPDDVVKKVKESFSFFKSICEPLDEVSTMEDGDEFIGDAYCLKVIHTPGHSSGTCCLYETQQKILFSGDHVIKHLTPNPFIELKRDQLRDRDYQSLKAYIRSLNKIADCDVRFVLPGHGEYFTDLQSVISSYLQHHRERMDTVWQALKRKSRPLYYLIDDVFSQVPEREIFLALSEIIVHLEMLVCEKRAELVDEGPPALYRALAG